MYVVFDGLPFQEKGWRGSDDEVVAFVNKLVHVQRLFASNVSFGWSGSLTTVQQPAISRGMSSGEFYNAVVNSNWASDHINIYFTGQVEAPGVLAFTIDPTGAASVGAQHIIVINDGEDSAISRGQLMDGNVLEHEVTHFFARWRNQSFSTPPPLRTYNAPDSSGNPTEHVLDPAQNILDQFFPHTLRIPGLSTQVGSERHFIWNRVDSGLVFVP